MNSGKELKEPGKILGKNMWVMGPLKETTIEKIAQRERNCTGIRELDEVSSSK